MFTLKTITRMSDSLRELGLTLYLSLKSLNHLLFTFRLCLVFYNLICTVLTVLSAAPARDSNLGRATIGIKENNVYCISESCSREDQEHSGLS